MGVRSAVTSSAEAMSLRLDRLLQSAALSGDHRGFELMRADTVRFRTDTMRELLGTSTRTFDEWCERNIAAFI